MEEEKKSCEWCDCASCEESRVTPTKHFEEKYGSYQDVAGDLLNEFTPPSL